MIALDFGTLAQEATDTDTAPQPRRRAAGWPLMGDIMSCRGGVPEHLIQWRRSEDAPDPDPQL